MDWTLSILLPFVVRYLLLHRSTGLICKLHPLVSLSLSLSPPLLAASLPSASPPLRPSALCADIRLGSCVSTRSFLSGFFLLLPRILGWIFFVCCRIVRWRIFPLGSGPLETPRWILRDFLRFFRILIGVVIFCLFEADPS